MPDQATLLSPDLRRRRRFTLVTLGCTIVLLSWGAVVTSIDAGLAVPDWPTSFDSYDPINPMPQWYAIPPVLAEHGHRLLGMLVGFCTIVLAGWTWYADPRRWMKYLGMIALVLVIVQGTLGGFRVLWQSLNLAVIHACVAQLYFSLLAAMWVFTTPTWLNREGLAEGEAGDALRRYFWLPVSALYGQVVLGAVLRHVGQGVDVALAMIHMTGAFLVFGILLMAIRWVRLSSTRGTLVHHVSGVMAVLLVAQIGLGFVAYAVLLQEAGIGRSGLQVLLNTTHMVVGASLMAATVMLTILGVRKPLPEQHLRE
ncbi:MAG: COX15/CtaA family protein [Rhodothermales bacterium]|nr:COX15/CtaA family protein [Rhodothermales bacterium]